MRPLRGFDHKKVKTLEEAWKAASRCPGEARYLAGGTDLLPQMKRGAIQVPLLISLKGVRYLNGLTDYGEWVNIGPLTAIEDVVRSEILKKKSPLLSLAGRQVGSVQIRNLGTVGGNICNASPSADVATALMCVDAELKIEGPDGVRSEKLEDFFKGPGLTSLSSTEIVTGILVPAMGKNWNWNYRKLGSRRAMEIGIVNVAIGLKAEQGICKEVRIALGSVAPTPIRARKAEKRLEGARWTRELVEEAAELGAQDSNPIDDLRASAAYRREMVRNLVLSELMALQETAAGEG